MTAPPDPAAVAAAERDHAARLYAAHQATCRAVRLAMGRACQAGYRIRDEWRECGAPAVALHRYACVHEHVRDRWTCSLHEPVPGAVGCRACHDAGHECEMAWQPGCAACASLAGHAERTARQAELLAPAQTPEMF